MENVTFLSKLANRQYVLLALSITPFLAALLAYLCRSGNGPDSQRYVFAYNDNIPSFLFMSVIVALFVGLIISAEEIIKDRNILFRESYLKLNKASYLNSKVIYLFALSAIQSLLFVIIGNTILGIHGMIWYFWLILFSTSCFANILGLLISAIFNSVVVIYIVVPLVIVPQILLSGVVVNFDKLNRHVASNEFVPFVGDINASRWAYEALVVTQFKYNDYQKQFFDIEKQLSNEQFNYLFVIPEIFRSMDATKKSSSREQRLDNIDFVNHELKTLQRVRNTGLLPVFSVDATGKKENVQVENYLVRQNAVLLAGINKLSQKKDELTKQMVSSFGSVDKFLEFKNRNYNSRLTELVLKRQSLQPFNIEKKRINRTLEPVYQQPSSFCGRAQFLSSAKFIGNFEFNTLFFNVLAIWFMTCILYIILSVYFYRYRRF